MEINRKGIFISIVFVFLISVFSPEISDFIGSTPVFPQERIIDDDYYAEFDEKENNIHPVEPTIRRYIFELLEKKPLSNVQDFLPYDLYHYESLNAFGERRKNK